MYSERIDQMLAKDFKRTRLACYTAYFTMSSVFCLPPVLFVVLREMYHISYTLLGTLVLINFCTQLTIDLIFTFFSKHFNVKKVTRTMPLVTSLGLLIYAVFPMLFPEHAFVGLFIGTVVFSVSAGLSEVLLSPVIAAIPSENPQKDMSTLHSLYAFGVFSIVLFSTLFLRIFGHHNWMYLTMILALLPVLASYLFITSPMPDMDVSSSESTSGKNRKNVGILLCVLCIFLGSCAENTMSNWISSFMENALHIEKTLGDILGTAMFAVLLGLARISYGKYGKRIIPVLVVGMIGAAICYLVAGLCPNVMIAFIACILTGLFSGMLWPGTLILMEEKIPSVGVAAYALMAASGDLGASVAPQLLGVVVDQVSASDLAIRLSQTLALTSEQIGMKAGMLLTAVFPILGVVVLIAVIRYFKKSAKP